MADEDSTSDFHISELRSGPSARSVSGFKCGTTVNGYKLLSILGEGGFGTVYLAETAPPLRRRVALKVIKAGMDSKQVIARFEAERQALAVMDHPNVAKVFDAGMSEGGQSYFVMEHVKGVPLTEHCDRYKLSIPDRLRLFIDVCEAVQHAHHKGIIHRDLKPSNVLVAIEGDRAVPKVIDFGVAKAIAMPLTEKTLYTEQGQIIGTPEYMSPEQAEMTGQDIDTRTDVYSLGVVMYELLTGCLPFPAEYLRTGGLNHLLQVIREEEPKSPSTKVTSLDANDVSRVSAARQVELDELRKTLGGDLDWMVLKAMEKDRQRRYETAHGLAADVQRYLDDEPIVARPPSTGYKLQKLVRRNKGLVAATAIVAIVLLAATAVSLWQARIATAEKNRALIAEGRAEEARQESTAKQRALQETLNQLHSVLIDKVYLELAGADEAKVKAAVDQAALASVPEETLQFYRGQQALLFGRPEQAIKILSPLVEKSVAARALLAEAQLLAGDVRARDANVAILVQQINESRSLTYEDRMFAAATLIDEEAAGICLELVDGLLDERDTPVARLILATVLAAAAHQTFDRELICEAKKHIDIANAFGGGARRFLDGELMVNHVAWTLGVTNGVVFSPAKIADFEKQLADDPLSRGSLVRYLADIEHERAATLAESYLVSATDVELLYYVPILLRFRSPIEVLGLMEPIDSLPPYGKIMRIRVLALIPVHREETLAMCEELFVTDENIGMRLTCLDTLSLLGEFDRVTELSRKLNAAPQSSPWYHTEIKQYLAGRIDQTTFLGGAVGGMESLQAHFVVATQQLGRGEIDDAFASLQRCVEEGQFHSENHHFAKAFLHAIETKQDWVVQLGWTRSSE